MARLEAKEDQGVSVIEHEGGCAASATCSLEGDYDAAVEESRRKLSALAEWVERDGGIVGHIKASLAKAPTITMLSTTGDDVSVLPVEAKHHRLDAVAIVFDLERDALKEKVSDLFLKG